MSILRKYPWATQLIFLMIVDGALSLSGRGSILFFNGAIYAWGVAMSVLLHLILAIFYQRLNFTGRRFTAFAIATFFALMLFTNILLARFTGLYLNQDSLHFIRADIHYLTDYVRTYLLAPSGAIALCLFFSFLFLWWPSKHLESIKVKRPIVWSAIMGLAYFISLNAIAGFQKEFRLPLDTSSLTALGDIYALANKPTFHQAERTPIPNFTPGRNSPNVLLFVHESWGKTEGMRFYGHTDNAMPFMHRWIDKEPSQFYVFQRAHTNSTQTDISITSLFTGVAPDESVFKLHKTPLMWQWAKAAGYQTFFVSSQRMSWYHLNEFLFNPELDIHIAQEELGCKTVNDMGCDDLVAARKMAAMIKSMPEKSPFFGVFFSNALHVPFQKQSDHFAPKNPKTDYQAALAVVDRSMQEIMTALEKRDLLKNTLIIMTADHGEVQHLKHSTSRRIYSFHREYFEIPFLIRVPEKWQRENPEFALALRKNQMHNTQNLDVAPTLIDLLQPAKDGAHGQSRLTLQGHSLLRHLPADRFIIGSNSGDRNSWSIDGFGIAAADKKLVYSTTEGPMLFSRSHDPDETLNLWPGTAIEERAPYLQLIRSRFHLQRVFEPSVFSRYHMYLRLRDSIDKN